MFFQAASYTDQGNTRPSNQDAFTLKIAQTAWGQTALAVLCDGMGGLSQGEFASAQMVFAFERWFQNELPALLRQELPSKTLAAQWNRLVQETSLAIRRYGSAKDIRLGTTVTALLATEHQYYLMHIGDCRAYRISDGAAVQLTQDQTLAARELRSGHITQEEFQTDARKNVLLQCVGAGDSVTPELLSAPCGGECVFLLCSDGFYHTLSSAELGRLVGKEAQKRCLRPYLEMLGRQCRQRGEEDNLTALTLSLRDSSCSPTRLMEPSESEDFLQVLVDETQVCAPNVSW